MSPMCSQPGGHLYIIKLFSDDTVSMPSSRSPAVLWLTLALTWKTQRGDCMCCRIRLFVTIGLNLLCPQAGLGWVVTCNRCVGMKGPAVAQGVAVSSHRGHWLPVVTAPVGLDCLCLLGPPQSTMGVGPLGRVRESATKSSFFELQLLRLVRGDVAGRLHKSSPCRLKGQYTSARGSNGCDSVLVRSDFPSLLWGGVHKVQELTRPLATQLDAARALQTWPVQDFGEVGPGVVTSPLPSLQVSTAGLGGSMSPPKM